MNIYAAHFLGTVPVLHKKLRFYAKRLKKVCREQSRNGPRKNLFILLQPHLKR